MFIYITKITEVLSGLDIVNVLVMHVDKKDRLSDLLDSQNKGQGETIKLASTAQRQCQTEVEEAWSTTRTPKLN